MVADTFRPCSCDPVRRLDGRTLVWTGLPSTMWYHVGHLFVAWLALCVCSGDWAGDFGDGRFWVGVVAGMLGQVFGIVNSA